MCVVENGPWTLPFHFALVSLGIFRTVGKEIGLNKQVHLILHWMPFWISKEKLETSLKKHEWFILDVVQPLNGTLGPFKFFGFSSSLIYYKVGGNKLQFDFFESGT